MHDASLLHQTALRTTGTPTPDRAIDVSPFWRQRVSRAAGRAIWHFHLNPLKRLDSYWTDRE
jgi:hypothetical protein